MDHRKTLIRLAVGGLVAGASIACGGGSSAPPKQPSSVTIPRQSDEPESRDGESHPTTNLPERDRSDVAVDPNCCAGKNECKGLGRCAVQGANDCAGKNECKGKGGCHHNCPPAAQEKSCCKGMNECKGKGNCKTDAHACKGMNDCKGQGGCKGFCPR